MRKINQFNIEFEIHQCLKFGVETELAKAAGKSVAYYSSMLNPSDERESTFYKAAQDFANWSQIDNEGFIRAWSIFKSHIEQFIASDARSLNDELAKSVKEDADVATAVLKNESPLKIVKECGESIAQKQRVIKAAMVRLEQSQKAA